MAKKKLEVDASPAPEVPNVEVEVAAKPDSITSMLDAIAADVGKLGPAIREGLIKVRAEKVLNQKITALDQGFAHRARLLKDLNKIRADNVSYDIDGKETRSEWSKEQLKKRRECLEQVSKIEKCLRLALDQDDYAELYKQTDQRSEQAH